LSYLLTNILHFQVFSLVPSDISGGVFFLDGQDVDDNSNIADDPSDNSVVSEVIDRFNNSHTWSQNTFTKQPLFQEDSLNGYSSLFFDGVDDILELYDHIDIWSGTWYAQKSFAMVFQTWDDVTSPQTIYEQWWKEKGFLFMISSGSLYAWVYNSIDWPSWDRYKILNLWLINMDTAYSLVFIYDSVNDFVKAYLDGVESLELTNISQQTTNGACPLDGTSFGCNIYSSWWSIWIWAIKNDSLSPETNSWVTLFEWYHFNWHIWEIVSWNKWLTDMESLWISDYFKIKWWFDNVPPLITLAHPWSGSLLPGKSHTFEFHYNDTHSWSSQIDSSSAGFTLQKWNAGSWSTNISQNHIQSWSTAISATWAILWLDNLVFGRYRYSFSISDFASNTSSVSNEFYIDEPEFIISTPEINLWDVNVWDIWVSRDIVITVRTIWAWFRVLIEDSDTFDSWLDDIPMWNGTEWYWYTQELVPNTLESFTSPTIVGSQLQSININGEKNTYSYTLKIWTLVDMQQLGWEYIWDIDFHIELDY